MPRKNTTRTAGQTAPPAPGALVWVLGSQDTEMNEIRAVLLRAKQTVVYATSQGDRTRGATAYQADDVFPVNATPPRGSAAVLVECDFPQGLPLGMVVVARCDHHRPGDAGYGRPPAEYMAASSIGQVLALLGRQPTAEQRLLAAGDHCLAAAYQGMCPGIDPKALAALRRGWVARGCLSNPRGATALAVAANHPNPVVEGGRDLAWWLAGVDAEHARLRRLLRGAPLFEGAPERVLDLREYGHLPAVHEVLALLGYAGVLDYTSRAGDRRVVLYGAGRGSVPGALPVNWFLDKLAPALGLRDTYGDPSRGFAGGYL